MRNNESMRLLPGWLFAIVLVACGADSATETAAAPEASLTATPVGLLGAPVDRRATLPEGISGPAELELDRALGNVLQLGARGNGTALRFNVWLARDDDFATDDVPYLAGYAIGCSRIPTAATSATTSSAAGRTSAASRLRSSGRTRAAGSVACA